MRFPTSHLIAAALCGLVLAGCSSEEPGDDGYVTLGEDGTGIASGPPSTAMAPAAPTGGGLEAVNAEGSLLEPLLTREIEAVGIAGKACRYSAQQGAVPILVGAQDGSMAAIKLSGETIAMRPSAAIGRTGAGFEGEGVSITVASSRDSAGREAGVEASLTVSDQTGPSFTYEGGYWACD